MKLFKKFELPFTIITLITLVILLYASFHSGNIPLIGVLSVGFITILIDFLGQLKDKKNVKS